MNDNLTGEFLDDELCATHLQINLYPVTPQSDKPFGTDEFEEIIDLVEEQGLTVSHESYHQTIVTRAFVTTDENIESVKHIASKIADWYPDNDVEAAVVSGSDRIVGGELFDKIQWITVEKNR